MGGNGLYLGAKTWLLVSPHNCVPWAGKLLVLSGLLALLTRKLDWMFSQVPCSLGFRWFSAS